MLTFHYNDSGNNDCVGEICILSDYDPIEMDIEANGWSFHTIVGSHRDGNYICIPNWYIGSELAGLGDVFWNEERLIKNTQLHPDNAKAIARAIAEADKWIDNYHKTECG
nr:hypothetical protein [Clostridia bacterium]